VIVVDASVWVSELVPRDVHHDASREWLAEQVARDTALVGPALVLPEVAGAISRQTGRSRLGRRALRWLGRLPGLQLIPVDHRLGTAAAEIAVTLELRGVDAVYVAAAHVLGVPLVTWDREQRERGGRLVAVMTPEERRPIPID
jgi:predicted nucleic acid-binding protein